MTGALGADRVAAYLARIGVGERPAPTAAALRELHWAHLGSVPFENLSIHLGEPISLDLDALVDKIVTRRRGGYCYELNGLFAALLTELGYEVELLAGAVYGPNGPGAPFDHLALSVDGWLADVGFGRHSAYPLRRADAGGQEDPCGTFHVVTLPGGDIDVVRNGEPQYRLEARPRQLADFARPSWWQETSPDSHFRRRPVCSLFQEDAGLVTVAGRQLIETTPGGDRTETALATDGEVLAAYRDRFGIGLDRVP